MDELSRDVVVKLVEVGESTGVRSVPIGCPKMDTTQLGLEPVTSQINPPDFRSSEEYDVVKGRKNFTYR
jgi:hypothetical protein